MQPRTGEREVERRGPRGKREGLPSPEDRCVLKDDGKEEQRLTFCISSPVSWIVDSVDALERLITRPEVRGVGVGEGICKP